MNNVKKIFFFVCALCSLVIYAVELPDIHDEIMDSQVTVPNNTLDVLSTTNLNFINNVDVPKAPDIFVKNTMTRTDIASITLTADLPKPPDIFTSTFEHTKTEDEAMHAQYPSRNMDGLLPIDPGWQKNK